MSEIRRSPFEDGVNPTTSLEGDMLQTMKECSRIAAENGISDMTLEEINEEIGKARAQI